MNEIKIERRIEKRTYLKYASAFTIFTEEGLIPFDFVELIDVSKDGLSFMLEKEYGFFKDGDFIHSRLYLNSFKYQANRYYLPLKLKITNTANFIDKTGSKIRYGCNIEYESSSIEKVLKDFIRFVESAAMYLRSDKGDYFLPDTIA
jgi:hypothetical protein